MNDKSLLQSIKAYIKSSPLTFTDELKGLMIAVLFFVTFFSGGTGAIGILKWFESIILDVPKLLLNGIETKDLVFRMLHLLLALGLCLLSYASNKFSKYLSIHKTKRPTRL